MIRFCIAIVCIVTSSCTLARQTSASSVEPEPRLAGAPTTRVTVHLPATSQPATGWPTVAYLRGFPFPRVGRASDESIVRGLLERGVAVVEMDYAEVAPSRHAVAKELIAIRAGLADAKRRSIATELKVDVDRVYILPAGYTVRRDVEFARDGDRVLAFDIAYPVDPAAPVPVLLEFTCDNVNRMGGFSLLYCRDTLLDGAALRGFAAAMVDHPVRAPYKGIDDPMPESLDRARSAVEALRKLSGELPVTTKLGAIGFSRGGPFAAMLAGRGDVDGALVHGNRYDYSRLAPDDPMRARFEKAWGAFDQNRDRWLIHGAAAHLTERCAPMYLNTSDAESPEYRAGLTHLRDALAARKVEHVYVEDADGRGHRVSLDEARLDDVYAFFARLLQ